MRPFSWVTSIAIVLHLTGFASAAPFSTTNLAFWIDANDPAGNGSAPTAGALTDWINKAPSANQRGVTEATQTTTLDKPSVVLNQLNGLPVVQFDGTNTFMATAAFSPAIAQPDQVFIVWQANSDSGGPGISEPASFAFDGLTANPNRQALFLQDNKLQAYAGAAVSHTYTVHTPTLDTLVYSGATSSFSVQGGSTVTGSASTNTLDGVTVGNAFGNGSNGPNYVLDGYIAEMLIFTTPLVGSDLAAVENYLNEKWFLPEPGSFSLAALGALIGLVTLRTRRRAMGSPLPKAV